MGCIDLPSNIDQQDQPRNTSDEKEIVEKQFRDLVIQGWHTNFGASHIQGMLQRHHIVHLLDALFGNFWRKETLGVQPKSWWWIAQQVGEGFTKDCVSKLSDGGQITELQSILALPPPVQVPSGLAGSKWRTSGGHGVGCTELPFIQCWWQYPIMISMVSNFIHIRHVQIDHIIYTIH
jgi:hypothetical protein